MPKSELTMKKFIPLKKILLISLCLSVIQLSYAEPSDGSYLKPADNLQQKTKWILAYRGTVTTTLLGQISDDNGYDTISQSVGPFPLGSQCDLTADGNSVPNNVRIETSIVANGNLTNIDSEGNCAMNRINLNYAYDGNFRIDSQTKEMFLGFKLIYSFALNNVIKRIETHHTWSHKDYRATVVAQTECNRPGGIPIAITIYCKSKEKISS